MLSQEQDCCEKTIAYASRSLSKRKGTIVPHTRSCWLLFSLPNIPVIILSVSNSWRIMGRWAFKIEHWLGRSSKRRRFFEGSMSSCGHESISKKYQDDGPGKGAIPTHFLKVVGLESFWTKWRSKENALIWVPWLSWKSLICLDIKGTNYSPMERMPKYFIAVFTLGSVGWIVI